MEVAVVVVVVVTETKALREAPDAPPFVGVDEELLVEVEVVEAAAVAFVTVPIVEKTKEAFGLYTAPVL